MFYITTVKTLDFFDVWIGVRSGVSEVTYEWKKIAKISNNERVVSVNSDDKMKVKNSAFHYHRQNSHSYSRKSPRFKLNISFLWHILIFTLDNCFLRSLKRFHLYWSSSFYIPQGFQEYFVNKIDRDVATYYSAFMFIIC